MKSKVKQVFVLLMVGVISALLLSSVYKETKPVIEKYKKEQLQQSLRDVFPDSSAKFETIKSDTLWRVTRDDSCIGLIFRYGKSGYSSVINVIAGVKRNEKIVKVKIPKQGLAETPGLGMRVTEDWFQKQFSGLREEELFLKKDKTEGKLDAITSATISSRAAVEAVREGLKKYKEYLPGGRSANGGRWFEKYFSEFLGECEIEKIIEGKVWKGGGKSVFLNSSMGYSSEIFVIVGVKNDTIKDLHIQRPEEGLGETTGFGTRVASEDYEEKFTGIPVEKVGEVDALSGATMTSRAVKKAIAEGYKNLIQEDSDD